MAMERSAKSQQHVKFIKILGEYNNSKLAYHLVFGGNQESH